MLRNFQGIIPNNVWQQWFGIQDSVFCPCCRQTYIHRYAKPPNWQLSLICPVSSGGSTNYPNIGITCIPCYAQRKNGGGNHLFDFMQLLGTMNSLETENNKKLHYTEMILYSPQCQYHDANGRRCDKNRWCKQSMHCSFHTQDDFPMDVE